MEQFFNFANTLVKRVFTLDSYSVVEVKLEDYIHYEIVAREGTGLIQIFVHFITLHFIWSRLAHLTQIREPKCTNYLRNCVAQGKSKQICFQVSLWLSITFYFVLNNFFSVYRSTNYEECQVYYFSLKDKLPVFSRYFPNFSLSQLSEMCKYITAHPTQVNNKFDWA